MSKIQYWEKDRTKMVGIKDGLMTVTMKWDDLNDGIQLLLKELSIGTTVTSDEIPWWNRD